MWEFPAMDVKTFRTVESAEKMFLDRFGLKEKLKHESMIMKHIYSHISLQYKAYLIDTKKMFKTDKFKKQEYQKFKWARLQDLDKYPIHNAHKKVVEWFNTLEIESPGNISR